MESGLVSHFNLLFCFCLCNLLEAPPLLVKESGVGQSSAAWLGTGGVPGQHNCFLFHNNHCAARPRIGNLWEGERNDY